MPKFQIHCEVLTTWYSREKVVFEVTATDEKEAEKKMRRELHSHYSPDSFDVEHGDDEIQDFEITGEPSEPAPPPRCEMTMELF